MKPVGIIGNYNIDIIIGYVTETPRWDTEIMGDQFVRRIAGTAGYMVLALDALHVPAVIISSVGQDEAGEFLLKFLREKGLKTEGIAQLHNRQTPTGFVIVHQDGNRAIISVSGAHDDFDLSIYHQKKNLLESCEEIMICGTYLLPKFTAKEAIEVAKEQRSLGKKIYFDPGWDPNGWKEDSREQVFRLLEYIDVFMPNEMEICHLTGKNNWNDALEVVSKYCREVVVKLGGEGAAVLKDGKYVRVQGNSVNAVDTTGAGDTFDMGYLWVSRQNKSLEDRLYLANLLSSRVVSLNNRDKYPSLEELLSN